MKIVLAVGFVLLVGVVVLCWKSWRKYRRAIAEDRAELTRAVVIVSKRLSACYCEGVPFKDILRCDFVEVVDGREQRLIEIDAGEFYLYVSKEIKRPRVWAKIKKGESYTVAFCHSTSDLGEVANFLFSSIDQYPIKPQG